MDSETKVRTKNGSNTYYIRDSRGNLVLVSLEYPYEGCDPVDSKLFKDIESAEKYIDDNSPKYEDFIVNYISITK